jgi:ubiquitin-protein ligase
MYESPQMRRLKNDLIAMEALAGDSTVFRFTSSGKPATRYLIEFHGRSLAREKGKVAFRDFHQVEIKLGAAYPRTMPEMRWLTPIYHPNISEIGLICLGGYGTHWVPSLHLDDLCTMLWDMARYHNYDIRSPYNREAALWASNQTTFPFPTDMRPMRDRRFMEGRIESPTEAPQPSSAAATPSATLDSKQTIPTLAPAKAEPATPVTAQRMTAPSEEVVFFD